MKRIQVVELIAGDPALKDCRFLLGMPESVRLPLLETAVLQRFPDKARLFEQGAAGNSLFLVARGEATLVGEKNGKSVDVANAKKGDVLGEAEVLGAKTRTWTAVAAGEVDVVELPFDAMAIAIKGHPRLREFLTSLDRERKSTFEEMASFLGRW